MQNLWIISNQTLENLPQQICATLITRTTSELTHESSGVGDIGADLAVDLDEPLHADLLHLIPSQGVLEAIPQEDDEGQALPQLVGTGGRTRSLRKNMSDYFRSSN